MAGRREKRTSTFVVHINRCENSTWQGDVIWAEENRKEVFRSALELIRLIDGVLYEELQDVSQAED